MKPPTPTQASDTFIGDEEHDEKQKKEQRNRKWDPNPTALDHLVISCDLQGSYGDPIVLTLSHLTT